eukprot:1337936-Amorphochlora_amoeboformis.AAC.1
MEISQHATYTCQFCGKDTMKRVAVGIWCCKMKAIDYNLARMYYRRAGKLSLVALGTPVHLQTLLLCPPSVVSATLE